MQAHDIHESCSESSRPVVYSRRPDPAAVAAMLDEWMNGDPAEQRTTLEWLMRSLDEGRPDGYKLFP